jgi:cation diffusion facilitator family transporter
MDKKVTKVIGISVINNLFLIVIKLVFGFLGNSQALIADGIHSISDFSTDVVAFFGYRTSTQPADEDHPFGHGRFEYLTSIAIGIFVFVLGAGIVYNTFNIEEVYVPKNIVAIAIAITIILKYLVSNHLISKGNEYKNKILISSGIESRADVLTSIVVMITFILSKFQSSIGFLVYADAFGSFIVGLFILNTAVHIIRDSAMDIIGKVEVDEELVQEVCLLISSIDGVKNVDKVTLMKFGPYNKVITEIAVDSNETVHHSHEIAHQVEDVLIDSTYSIKYVTVHINPYYEGDFNA